MRNIKRKLRSRVGASMILALVFLMFCSFVGSSVLVSATANAARLAHHREQQDFLNQRSAALLLSDELQMEEGQQLRLYIMDSVKLYQEMKPNATTGAGSGGYDPTGREGEERVITFQLITNDTDITEMQRLMLETTIWRYLREELAEENRKTTVVLSNFLEDELGNDIEKLNQFWYSYLDVGANNVVAIPANADTSVRGVIQVRGTMNGDVKDIDSFPAYEAYFSSGRDSNLYDFYVDFGDESQLRLAVDAYFGTTNLASVPGDIHSGTIPSDIRKPNYTAGAATGYYRIVTTPKQTLISWGDPTVEKGSAVSIDKGVVAPTEAGGA